MRNRRKSKSKMMIIIVLLALIAGAGYIYTAPEFEREAPVVHSDSSMSWNRKNPLEIKLSDNMGLKSFELILSDGSNSLIVGQGVMDGKSKEQTLYVKYPKSKVLDAKANHLTLKVSAYDNSFWNFFQGNHTEKVINIDIDYKRPTVNILANSYSITQGGTALVVFQAEDKNLKTLYVKTKDANFKVEPYKRKGYYATLIAWRFDKQNFHASIVAEDAAGNKRVTNIPFYLKNKNYKVSLIKARDNFIDGKITDLASGDPDYADIDDRLDKLRAINETMRLKNEALIHSLSKSVSSEILENWNIHRFYPLKNAKKVASFGAERHYYYNNKNNQVSHSFHLGYDLASTKMAAIKASNGGEVVYASENGIYGNMPMINHGLGLYTLYGHCSSLLVEVGQKVVAGETIAKTGSTGLALGDHLHFGILVQGIEVRPIEWFDGKWIKTNITNVFKSADKIIMQ